MEIDFSVLTQPDPVALKALRKDIANAAKNLSPRGARFLTDTHGDIQELRLELGNRVRTLGEQDTPTALFAYLTKQFEALEDIIIPALDQFSKSKEVGLWSRSVIGVGPVLAGALLATVDLSRSVTASNLWSYAGLNPLAVWKKGELRPWNASLKRLCFLIGEQFVRNSFRDNCFYGKIYLSRKEYENAKNEAGEYEELVKNILATKTFGEDTVSIKSYNEGKLPKGHIHSRCRRYCVKMFLAHYLEVGHFIETGVVPPVFAIAHLGHAHYVNPPNAPLGFSRLVTYPQAR